MMPGEQGSEKLLEKYKNTNKNSLWQLDFKKRKKKKVEGQHQKDK